MNQHSIGGNKKLLLNFKGETWDYKNGTENLNRLLQRSTSLINFACSVSEYLVNYL